MSAPGGGDQGGVRWYSTIVRAISTCAAAGGGGEIELA